VHHHPISAACALMSCAALGWAGLEILGSDPGTIPLAEIISAIP
jgi:hypothetical protein